MRDPVVGSVIPSDLFGFAERLTEAERAVLTELRQVLADQVRPYLNDAWDQARFPDEIIEPLRSLELMDPPALREAGEPIREIFLGFRNFELTRCDINVGTYYNAQASLFRTVCALGAAPEQAQELDRKIVTHELTGVFGLTEPEHGSDIAGGLATEATQDPASGEWIISGAKRWIGGAAAADVVATFARDTSDGQIRCFLVPVATEGLTIDIIPRKASLRIMQTLTSPTAKSGFRTLPGCRRSTALPTSPPACGGCARTWRGWRQGQLLGPTKRRWPTCGAGSSSADPSLDSSSSRRSWH